ncbi:MAG: hypothetical protein RL885_00965 [Planctomycetota bacterium]
MIESQMRNAALISTSVTSDSWPSAHPHGGDLGGALARVIGYRG